MHEDVVGRLYGRYCECRPSECDWLHCTERV